MSDVFVPFPQPLTPATILQRVTRFSAVVELSGAQALAYVPNSGRLPELMLSGTPALLAHAKAARSKPMVTATDHPGRRTTYDLLLVRPEETWVCVDTRVPNVLVATALRQRALAWFESYAAVRAEFPRGHSRFDFRLSNGGPDCLVEVKSVTLVQDGVGLFPDAPTERGRRHVLELAEAVRAGLRAAVLFVAQRADACCFAPNDAIDPAFGEALRAAAAAGVEIHTYGCDVSVEGIRMREELRIRL